MTWVGVAYLLGWVAAFAYLVACGAPANAVTAAVTAAWPLGVLMWAYAAWVDWRRRERGQG